MENKAERVKAAVNTEKAMVDLCLILSRNEARPKRKKGNAAEMFLP